MFFLLASTSMTICICVSQYIAVISQTKKLMTSTNCFAMVVIVWVISFCIAFGPIVKWGRYKFNDIIYECKLPRTTNVSEKLHNAAIIVYAFILPFFTMLFTYTAIIRKFQHHCVHMLQTEQIMSTTQSRMNLTYNLERKICFTMVIGIVTFLLCRTPLFIYILLLTMQVIGRLDFLGQLAFWAVYLHSTANPFIYAYKHVEYRETLNEIQRSIRVKMKSVLMSDNFTPASEK